MANVLTFIEFAHDRASWGSLLTLRLGRDLASRLGATLYALLPCASPPLYGDDDIIAQLSHQGADKVILMTHSALVPPARFRGHGEAVLSALHQFSPTILLFPAGATGEDIAPRVAARLGADYAHLPRFITDPVDSSDVTVAQPLFGGRASHRFKLGERATPLVATVAPDPQQHSRPRGSEEAEVVVISPSFPKATPPSDATPLAAPAGQVASDRVVLGGAGVRGAEAWQALHRLAKRLDADLLRTRQANPTPTDAAPPIFASTPGAVGMTFVLAAGVDRSEWDDLPLPETSYVVGIHPDRTALQDGAVHLALAQPIPEAVEAILKAAEDIRPAPSSDQAVPSDRIDTGSLATVSARRSSLGTADTMKVPITRAPEPVSPQTNGAEAATASPLAGDDASKDDSPPSGGDAAPSPGADSLSGKEDA